MRRPLWSCVITLLSIAVLGMATAGCGDGATPQTDEPPADGGFVGSDFSSLPRPDGAVPITDPTVNGRTTAQSFKVVGSGVEEIVGFYQVELPNLGWEPRGAPAEVGDGDWQGGWARGDETLEVSVSPYNGDDPVSSQVDLVLTR